jgi:leader peptidase (prepilin peptidase)/N-methyltransferase
MVALFMVALLVIAGLAGLVVGSLITVVIRRYAGTRPRYPLVELATSLLFVAVTVRFGRSAVLPAYLYLAAVAVALAVIDVEVRRLPNAIVLPSYLVGAALLAPVADWRATGRGLVAMAALLALYAALAALRPGGMGLGDVKLAGLLGFYLGWLGWSPVWVGTLAGFLFGGLAGLAVLVTRPAAGNTAIPFGPYMLAGAMLAVLAAGPLAGVLAW